MPTSPKHTLSKSDFKLARSCPTKLYYRELKYPDTRDDNEYLQLLAEGGYMVELLAKQLFPDGITLDYTKGAQISAEETQRLLAEGAETVTLFEATLRHDLRLARVDVLKRSATGFDLYEVKSSSIDSEDALKRIDKTGSAFRSLRKPFAIASDWREYLEDVTYQVTILRDLFPDVPVRAHLILMDKQRKAEHDEMPAWFRILRREDGRLHTAEFIGDPTLARTNPLTVSMDVTAEVDELEAEVREAAAEFVASLAPELRKIPPEIGAKCRGCEFRVGEDKGDEKNGFRECWGPRADAKPHILNLYQGRDLLVTMIERGVDRVTDIPDEVLQARSGAYAERQLIQVTHSRSGEEYVDSSLRHDLDSARWPLHFIDFEAARIAVPHHKGMTPYGQLAFQWSCHTQREPGAPLEHREYLNTDPRWPNETFAHSLRTAVGDDGTLLVWSAFERSVLSTVAEELSALGSGDTDLEGWLRLAAMPISPTGGRQLDMLALCRKKYFHPAMQGSNSIKAVLDALWKHVPDVRSRFLDLTGREGDPSLGPYAALDPIVINGEAQAVAEGTAAMNAYFAMVYGVERDDALAREQWSQLLKEYCKLDTLAMVLIWEHWLRISAAR